MDVLASVSLVGRHALRLAKLVLAGSARLGLIAWEFWQVWLVLASLAGL